MRNFSIIPALLFAAAAHAQAPAPLPPARQTGTVTAVSGNTLTLTTAAKTPASVTVAAGASVLQLPPCGTNLKQATAASFAGVEVGDRVITGKAGDTDTASRVILMKAADSASCRTKQQADWQQHGVSGTVKSAEGSMLTVGVGTKTLAVSTSGTTLFRRYADDSVNYEDAKPGTLAQVQAGDQISVRGAKSDDGTSMVAEEVVSGTFENLAGTLTATDAAAGTITLKDLATKKSVTIKVTANSDLRKLPPQAAAMFGAHPAAAAGSSAAASTAPAGTRPAGAGGGSGRARSGADLSRMLSRFPAETVADMHPGEAVMVVASLGRGGDPTAITLLSGVEQLLAAAPAGGQPITLSPWNLGGVPEGGSQ